MRILQATDCYPPPLIGGRDLHVQMLTQELARRGHDVEVVTMAKSDGARMEMDGDIPVHRLAGWSRALSRFYVDPDRPWHPTAPDPGMVRSLADLIRQRRPDIVHSHSWILHSLLPLLPNKQTRLVVTMHEYGLVCPKNTFLYKDGTCSGPGFAKCLHCASGQYGAVRATALTTGLTLTRPLRRRRVDRYIAVSRQVALACSSLVAAGRDSIEVIPPFLLDESLEEAQKPRPDFVPATGDYLMFAGAMSRHKGMDVLLEAYDGMSQTVPLVVVGLRNEETTYPLPDGVIAVANVTHDCVLRAWANCAIAVVPSNWPEPFGMVAAEAMAAGRPVIASSVGGLIDIVDDGVTGLLVPAGDIAALRAAISTLLADPVRRTQMGDAGRERAGRYSAAVVVPQIERVYREAIDR